MLKEFLTKLKYRISSDESLYCMFLEEVAMSAVTQRSDRVEALGRYVLDSRPGVMELIFKFLKSNSYGKGFSNKPEESAV